MEQELVGELAARTKTVIATGGGLPMNPQNLVSLKTHALVVCLWASPEKIWERVKNQTHRPLLHDADPQKKIRDLLAAREPFYKQADVLINTERQALLTGGMATLTDDRDGSVRIERAVTTYQYAAGNIPDASYRDIMTAKVVQRIRYDWRNYVKLVYPRSKMAADGTLAAEYDDQIVTPRRMQSSWAARCSLYEKLGWIQNSAVTARSAERATAPWRRPACSSSTSTIRTRWTR